MIGLPDKGEIEEVLYLEKEILKIQREGRQKIIEQNEKIGMIMDKLKYNSSREILAGITQENYKGLLEYDIGIEQIEKAIEELRKMIE